METCNVIDIDKKQVIAANILGCKVIECFYCHDNKNGDSVFKEPYGAEVSISQNGNIANDKFAKEWLVKILDSKEVLSFHSEKVARSAFNHCSKKNKCLLFKQV